MPTTHVTMIAKKKWMINEMLQVNHQSKEQCLDEKSLHDKIIMQQKLNVDNVNKLLAGQYFKWSISA